MVGCGRRVFSWYINRDAVEVEKRWSSLFRRLSRTTGSDSYHKAITNITSKSSDMLHNNVTEVIQPQLTESAQE